MPAAALLLRRPADFSTLGRWQPGAAVGLIAELKRRNVIRVGLLYGIAAWLVLQVADVLFGVMGVPDWSLRLVFGILLLGLPVALIFAWVFELTPEGLKRERPADEVAADAPRASPCTGSWGGRTMPLPRSGPWTGAPMPWTSGSGARLT